MIAIPCAFRVAITSNSLSVSREVSEVVGSSMTMMRALVDNARAISTICRSPSDSDETRVLRRERQAELFQDRAAALADLRLVRNPEAARLVAEEDVLAHRQVRSERKFLVDDGDAIGPRGDRIAGCDRRAVDQDLAARIGRIGARENLHQGRFSRAVLAHQRVQFAGVNGKRDGLQRLHRVEGLADIAHFENRALDRRVAVTNGAAPSPSAPPIASPLVSRRPDHEAGRMAGMSATSRLS